MKPLEETCSDCPSRAIFPELGELFTYLQEDHPEFFEHIKKEQRSVIYAVIDLMQSQKVKISELDKQLIEATKNGV